MILEISKGVGGGTEIGRSLWQVEEIQRGAGTGGLEMKRDMQN